MALHWTQLEINVSQAADLLGCSESKIRDMENDGKLKSKRTESGHRRFILGDVLMLEKQEIMCMADVLIELRRIKDFVVQRMEGKE